MGFKDSSWGVLSFDCVRKRFSGVCGFYRFKGVGAAHKNQKRHRIFRNGASHIAKPLPLGKGSPEGVMLLS